MRTFTGHLLFSLIKTIRWNIDTKKSINVYIVVFKHTKAYIPGNVGDCTTNHPISKQPENWIFLN